MSDPQEADPDAELIVQTDNSPRPGDGPQPEDQHAPADVVDEA